MSLDALGIKTKITKEDVINSLRTDKPVLTGKLVTMADERDEFVRCSLDNAGLGKLNEIKNMSSKELNGLCTELREKIIKAVSKNGGHLASNLGMVEATVALHTVFNSPSDKIIFDVGHQSYAHKILTGREQDIDSLRTFGGISGFPRREESVHDVFSEGHSGTSASSALGVAEANRLLGKKDYAVAVIGDGSLTNGLVYEALNNCAKKDLRLIM